MGTSDEQLARMMKALSIVSIIQDNIDVLDPEQVKRALSALNNPVKPSNVKWLEPYVAHCREYPSYYTFQVAAAIMNRFDVKDTWEHDKEDLYDL